MDRSEIQETRSVIFGLLELISDLKEQINYQERAPIAGVPAELVCQWFDDHNPPAHTWFQDCFTQNEQRAIRAFHDFYNSKVDLLPDTSDIHELHKSIEWQLVVERAKATLNQIRLENA